MIKKRMQLTLFVNHVEAFEIEFIRKKFNPEQANLIDAHVTLCREDELENVEKILKNLQQLKEKPLVLEFSSPIRFENAKGVLLPTCSEPISFYNLRNKILQGVIEKPRKPDAHITLMHPRNSTCTNQIFEEICLFQFPKQIVFDTITLIEQQMGEKWYIINQFKIA